jgi:lysophospholipase L1-like esterase
MSLRRLLPALLFLVSTSLLRAVDAPTAPPPAPPARAAATPAVTGPARWEKEVAAYEKADRENPPRKGGILFIGSSSIRLWKTLAEDFPGCNVLNRGFGGSQISDSVAFIPRLVLPYEPRQIIMYAGGNDLNAGESPETIAADFRAFATKVHAALPRTKIGYIASAPNFKRWAQIENVKALNALIQAFCEEHKEYLTFIDTFPLMLGPDGKPLPDIFVKDGLHMNPKGYAIWTKHLRQYLTPEP